MKTVLIAPRKYVQGRNVLQEMGSYVKLLGGRPVVLWSPGIKRIVGDTVFTSLKQSGLEVKDVEFRGETTREEASRVAQIAKDFGADVVIVAIGNAPNPMLTRSTPDLETTRWGTIAADEETGQTSIPGVFAGGDITTGGATVILALGAGRKSAAAIPTYLS